MLQQNQSLMRVASICHHYKLHMLCAKMQSLTGLTTVPKAGGAWEMVNKNLITKYNLAVIYYGLSRIESVLGVCVS